MRRLHVELLALVVADHRCLLPAGGARGFLADNHMGDTPQIFRQRFAARMRVPLSRRCACQHFAPRFCFHFVPSRTRFFVGQQLELQIAQRLAVWTQ
jgi:hypothetical protein